MDCRFLHPWDSPGKNTGVGCHFLLQGNFPNPGIEPRSPALQADALTSEPPGKQFIKDHRFKCKTIQPLEENIKNLQDLGKSEELLSKTLKVQSIMETLSCTSSKLRSFFCERCCKEDEKTCYRLAENIANHPCGKGLMSRI